MEFFVTYRKQGGVENPALPLECFDGFESEREHQFVEENEDMDEPAQCDVVDEVMGQNTCL